MYKAFFNLDKDEVIRFETLDAVVEYNEKRITIAIIITNKRIIFLNDINKNTIIDTLNITGKFHTPPTLEPIDEISKKEIKHYCYIENGTEIETSDKNIFIFNHDVTDALND